MTLKLGAGIPHGRTRGNTYEQQQNAFTFPRLTIETFKQIQFQKNLWTCFGVAPLEERLTVTLEYKRRIYLPLVLRSY